MAQAPIIERINEKSIRIICSCGTAYTDTIEDKPHKSPQYLGEFSQYTNYHAEPCPTCSAINIFNMNLPPTGLEEEELEQEPFFPEHEIAHREKARGLMWKVRPDLKTKDRAKEAAAAQEKLEKARGLTLAQIKQEKARIARLATGRGE